MNSLLMQLRPRDTNPEEWRKQWENAAHTLQPLADVLKAWRKELGRIKASDFDTPNHYAKLVAELSQQEMLDRILALLPDSVDK